LKKYKATLGSVLVFNLIIFKVKWKYKLDQLADLFHIQKYNSYGKNY
jgi:hypothetical protein